MAKNKRAVLTADVGQIILELLDKHREDEENLDGLYCSRDDKVIIDSFTLWPEGEKNDPSNLIFTADTGEVFAIRVTRVG